MSDPNVYSWLVKVVVHDPRGKAWAPTNTTLEFGLAATVESEILGDLSPEDRAKLALGVTVSAERTDI